MANTYTYALIITIIFALFRFIETKYINKNNFSLKQIIKDAFYCYLASISGIYIANNVLSNEIMSGENIKVFTDEPNF